LLLLFDVFNLVTKSFQLFQHLENPVALDNNCGVLNFKVDMDDLKVCSLHIFHVRATIDFKSFLNSPSRLILNLNSVNSKLERTSESVNTTSSEIPNPFATINSYSFYTIILFAIVGIVALTSKKVTPFVKDY
jgi:hypothetical protein